MSRAFWRAIDSINTPVRISVMIHKISTLRTIPMVAANIMVFAEAASQGSAIAEALKLLKDAPVVPVVDGEGRLVGQLEARCLVKALGPALEAPSALAGLAAALEEKTAGDVMEKAFASISPETTVSDIAALMEKAHAVFVVDDGMRLLGRITPEEILERIWEYRERKGR